MKKTYTPGPWMSQRAPRHQHAIDRKWEVVAPMDGGQQVIVGEHTGIDCLTEANARLIAAAPDLLSALEGLFEQCAMVHKHWGDGNNSRLADDAQNAARAAIARAKGEA